MKKTAFDLKNIFVVSTINGKALLDKCDDFGVNYRIFGENGIEVKEFDACVAYNHSDFTRASYTVINAHTIFVFFHTFWC